MNSASGAWCGLGIVGRLWEKALNFNIEKNGVRSELNRGERGSRNDRYYSCRMHLQTPCQRQCHVDLRVREMCMQRKEDDKND